MLVGGSANERILPWYCSGECHTYGRLLHGYFATTTHQGGTKSWAYPSVT